MTIDKSGKWWRGTTAEDIDAYLMDYTSPSYAADRFEHARCTCGEDRFSLEVDDEQGCARRTCAACRKQHFMLDSDEHSSDASLEECACPCGGENFQFGGRLRTSVRPLNKVGHDRRALHRVWCTGRIHGLEDRLRTSRPSLQSHLGASRPPGDSDAGTFADLVGQVVFYRGETWWRRRESKEPLGLVPPGPRWPYAAYPL